VTWLRAEGVPARAIWSAIDAGMSPLTGLVMAAGLLRALGAQQYGLIVVALAVSNLSTAFNPAIAATTTKFVSEAIGAGATREHGVARIVTGSLLVVALIDALFIAVTLVWGNGLAGLVFGAGTGADVSDLRAILTLAVLAICVQQLDAIFAATLRGLEQFAYQAVMEVFARTMLAVAVILVAFITRNVPASLLAYCCAYGISAVVRALLVRFANPEKRLWSRPGNADVRRLLGFGGWMWLNALATVAYGTLDRILIGRLLGTGAAAHFSIYTQLSQLVHLGPSSLFAFVYPMFSRLRSAHGPGSLPLVRLYRNSFMACVSIAGLLLVGLLLFRNQLAHIMGGRAFEPSDSVILLLGSSYFLLTFNIVPYYFLLGVGRSRGVSLLNSASMAAAVVCMTFLIPAYGENGAALARFAYGFGTLSLVYQARKLLRK
jgi:O-antigen/teichoic acid export membrane protein